MIDQALGVLTQLVSYPTVSTDSNLDLIDYAADLLGKARARIVTTTDQEGVKANLYATIGPDLPGGVVLSGHTDVVPVAGQDWTVEPFRASKDAGRIWGRGTTDMKGFIACVLAMAPTFSAVDLERPIHVALTYDEEEGCRGAKVLLDELSRNGPLPSIALVGEPTELGVVVAHKGCYEYTTEVIGLEQHASMGAGGAGAIFAAARFIGMLEALAAELAERAPEDSPFDPSGATINVGRIAGGVARNITAASAVFDWEVRPVAAGEAEFVRDHVDRFVADVLLPDMRRQFEKADIRTTGVGAVGGFRLDRESPAASLASRLTGSGRHSVVSFGTEAGLFQNLGISTVVCGPGSLEQAHKPDEYIEISQLEGCLMMLHRLIDEVT